MTAAMRVCFRLLAGSLRATLALIRIGSPGAFAIVAPAALGIAPVEPVTLTPAEAWQRAGKRTPREQYADHLADRSSKPVGKAPADPGAEGLLQFA